MSQSINSSQLQHPTMRAKIEGYVKAVSNQPLAMGRIVNRHGKAVLFICKSGSSYDYICAKTRQSVKADVYKAFRASVN